MICYVDGSEVRGGDRVDYDGWQAVVHEVIDTPEKSREWGLKEQGVMFETEEAGLVFENSQNSTWQAIRLLGRLEDNN